MKKIYSITIVLLFAFSLIGQTRIYPPNLRAPSSGEGGLSPNVTLDWDAVTGQTTNITYEVQLAAQADFSDAITFDRTDVTALEMEELRFGKMYYWHVKAYDDEDPSDWSETWAFSIISVVDITSPKIDKDVYTTQEIDWKEITGLTKYELQTDTVYEWKADASVTQDDVFGSFVFDENNMWLVGEGGLIQQFNGTEWITMDAGTTEDLNSVTFVDASNGYAVGSGGVVLNYNGTDWSLVDAGTTKDLFGVSFADADNGWVAGAEGIILNFAGGSWSEQTSGTDKDIKGIVAINSTNAWACGIGKIVTHFNGADWIAEEVGSKDHYAISFADANNGWVVSKSGKIHYYNGVEWVEQKSGTTKDLFCVSFSGMTGYTAGKDGVMVSFNGDWRAVASGSEESLHTISINGDNGLTGGDAGAVVVKSADGFNSPYLRTYAISFDTTTYELSNLLFGKTIYYRMRSIHSQDTSVWTGGRSMNTYAAPELDDPSNGSSDTDLMLVFEWDEYTGSTDYTFQISRTEDFTNPIISFSDSTSTNYYMKFFGQDYYWRVNALHAEDVSDWSDAWSLTTINTVYLTSPENEEMDVASCPSYEWEEIVGAANYELWVDQDSEFSNPMIGIAESPTFQCAIPMERDTACYWKVRGVTSLDTTNWSAVWSFRTEGYAGIGDEFTNESVEIYPNPSDGSFTLIVNSYTNDNFELSIIDISGKLIYQDNIVCLPGRNNVSINLSELRKGLYFVNIRKEDNFVTKKLFIE